MTSTQAPEVARFTRVPPVPRDFRDAWTHAHGHPMPTALIGRGHGAGLTVEDLQDARALAEFVIAEHSPLLRLLGVGRNYHNLPDLTAAVIDETLEWAPMARLRPGIVLRWLAASAGGDDRAPAQVRTLLQGWLVPERWVPGGVASHRGLRRWHMAVPQHWAPLAWAAGLTPTQARDMRRVGDMTTEALRGLAEARGWNVPALVTLAALAPLTP